MVAMPESGGVRAMMGKESICLDLSKPEGRDLAREICARADVVVQGYRAGAVQRLGIDYQTIRQLNPDVIYLNASGYGVDGPYGARPAYAPSIASAAGIPVVNLGESNTGGGDLPMSEVQYLARRLGGASTTNSANADGVAAVSVATAILFGVYARDRGAGGQELCTSMVNSNAHMQAAYTVQYPGSLPPPMVDNGMYGFNALYRTYDAAEGQVFLAAASDREFARLADALGRPELAADPRFTTRRARQANDAQLADILLDVFSSRTAQQWEQALMPKGVGLVEVTQTTPEAVLLDTPLGREMDLITDVVDPTWDETPRQGIHVLLSRSATQAKPAVLAGQHTDEILREFGHGDDIARLRAENLVG
jgi:crotonobetainyl-CoA:carnitine CoA-transferase CaiB-like acyl-CoA transferase